MQRPSALGLFLCDQVIVDQDSVKLTLVGLFNAIRGHDFPLTPKPFDVYAELTVDRAV